MPFTKQRESAGFRVTGGQGHNPIPVMGISPKNPDVEGSSHCEWSVRFVPEPLVSELLEVRGAIYTHMPLLFL